MSDALRGVCDVSGVPDNRALDRPRQFQRYGSNRRNDHAFYRSSKYSRARCENAFYCLCKIKHTPREKFVMYLIIFYVHVVVNRRFIIFQVILKFSLRLALSIYGGLCILCAIIACCLPIETKGRAMKVRNQWSSLIKPKTDRLV